MVFPLAAATMFANSGGTGRLGPKVFPPLCETVTNAWFGVALAKHSTTTVPSGVALAS
jgi:hypothetical protein